MDAATLQRILKTRQSRAGAWAFGAGQDAVEPTCLAILALRHQPSAHLERALDTIENLQHKDGSWPAFIGDEPEGCWTTALAVLSLMAARHRTPMLLHGFAGFLESFATLRRPFVLPLAGSSGAGSWFRPQGHRLA